MNWRRDLVGLTAVAGFVSVCLLLLLGYSIDVSMRDVAMVMLGMLASKYGTVVDFHYGSSAGSAAKDQIIAEKKP